MRNRVESTLPQEIIGFVRTNEGKEKEVFPRRGKTADENRRLWQSAYLEDMVKVCELKNPGANIALIESVSLDNPLDERNPKHYNVDCSFKTTYPYEKTRAGALQVKEMSWDFENKRNFSFGVSVIGFVLGALI